ncbi:MAG: hypothetical protein BWZ03_00658 [bacterium ADurb.BinA186]|nr:MAG: hypothetical protein BWZ03_00658 [bacterium ADurb.BinA186]
MDEEFEKSYPQSILADNKKGRNFQVGRELPLITVWKYPQKTFMLSNGRAKNPQIDESCLTPHVVGRRSLL